MEVRRGPRILAGWAARLLVPLALLYDAATSEPAQVQAWLSAVAAAGLRPHVAFQHAAGTQCPDLPWSAPSRASCAGCTIVAGDVLDAGSFVRWIERFRAAADGDPRLWGLHNYSDVTYGRTTGTDAMLAAVPGRLWIEETGGIVTLRNAAGRATLATDEARAARAVSRGFAIARTRPRITRTYVYQWRAGATDRFDAGLVRPDGTARPSLAALAGRLRTAAAAAPAVTADMVGPAAPRPRRLPRGRRALSLAGERRTAHPRAGGRRVADGRARDARIRHDRRAAHGDAADPRAGRDPRPGTGGRPAHRADQAAADRRGRPQRQPVARAAGGVIAVTPPAGSRRT